jgi:sugar (pentulose or hexulose) kinase
MQLIADLDGAVIEVLEQPEPGCVGAALLAGLANGSYSSLEEGAKSFSSVAQTYEPEPKRFARYEPSLQAYQATVSALLKIPNRGEGEQVHG